MERSIIHAIKNGDRQAFQQLYEMYFAYAMRVATVVMKQEGNAADAVQETFIRVYQHIHQYDLKQPFKPWFYRILINECKRIIARSAKVIPVDVDEGWENNAQLAEKDRYEFEQFDDLYRAIQLLKEHQRLPIILKYIHDLTDKEIAEVLDINTNTVKSRLFKARNHLKKVLEQMEEKEGSR